MDMATTESPKISRRHMPGEEGIWLLICGDLTVFSLFFITFLYYRRDSVELFISSQTHLNQVLGVLNTFLMLSSSWLVASGVQAARRKPGTATPVCFALAFMCGLGFVGVKIFEYSEKIRQGITLTTNDFYMYYYMFTGIHLMHVMIGMGVLAFMAKYSWAGRHRNITIRHLESGASFWHVVDLLWIVLFALLYLAK